MFLSYTGEKNQEVLDSLRIVAAGIEEDVNRQIEMFYENGEASFETIFDYYSQVFPEPRKVNLSSMGEIWYFFKHEAASRINKAVGYKESDLLLSGIINFICKNLRYPSDEEMKMLENRAERTRILKKYKAEKKKTILQCKQLAQKIFAKREKAKDYEMKYQTEDETVVVYEREVYYTVRELEITFNLDYDSMTGEMDGHEFTPEISLLKNVLNILKKFDEDVNNK